MIPAVQALNLGVVFLCFVVAVFLGSLFFSLWRVFGSTAYGIRSFGFFGALPMSKLFGFSGNDEFFLGGSIYPNPKDTALFAPSLTHHMDVYFPPRKRSRISAPFVFEQKQTSIEILPDECLFEIFRRFTGGRERSACACVSKRWLNLLSCIQRDELKFVSEISTTNTSEVEHENIEDDGYLSRSLEGKKATDTRLAAVSLGTARRGGLGKLLIRGTNSASKVSDLGLRAIACGCPSLRVLSLWNLSTVSDAGLTEIAKGCPLLEKLDLSRCPNVTDKTLVAMAENCPNLSDLTIESCSSVGNEGLQAIAKCCANLKSVSIKNCPRVGDQGIAALLSQTTFTLSKLKLQMLNITDLSLAVVGHYGRSVTDLVLSGLPNVTERGFWVMGNGQGLQKLKSLSVMSCQGVTDRGLEAVGRGSPNLKNISLGKCFLVSDNGLVSFAKAAVSVESLKLEECHRITQYGFFAYLLSCGAKLKAFSVVNCLGIREINASLPLSSSCNSVRSVCIRNCPGFGDASVALLAKLCPQLQDLELCGLKGITDAAVLPIILSSEAGLVKLNLSGCVNLTDRVVSAIAAQHSWTLEVLNVEGCCNISDASLVSIAKGCHLLSDLDVSKCAVTDVGIKALASAKQLNLQIFSIAGCSMLTDKSLHSLVKMGRTLLGLNLQNCNSISCRTVDVLLEQLWRCDILY